MEKVLMVALVSVVWSVRPIIGSDTVQFKTTVMPVVPEVKIENDVHESLSSVDSGVDDNNDTSLCDRYLRSTEVEVRSPRNHKFVTSNGWTERQRPRPEINVYPRVEEQPQASAQPSTSTFYQQQRDSAIYQHTRQQQLQPTVRSSKRIIYYATLPDVIRPPAGYPPPGYSGGYPAQPPSGYPGKYSAPPSGYSGRLPASPMAGYSGGPPNPPPASYLGGLPAPPPANYPGGLPAPPSGYPGGLSAQPPASYLSGLPAPAGYSGGLPPPPAGYPSVLPAPPAGYPMGLPVPPSGYPGGYPASPSGYSADPFATGQNPLSADFRQLESNKNSSPDNSQRNRLAPYENTYNRGGGGGGGGGGVTSSITSKTTAVYKSRYDEPAEFRDSFYRPNDFTSKYTSWSEPFYKDWSSSDKEMTSFGNSKDSSSYPWDREPLDEDGSWDIKEPTWATKNSPWEKELVEVPLKKPSNAMNGGGSRNFNNDRYPEVAVVQSEVIDVRGNGQQNSSPPPRPLPSYEIIDVDPKPYRQQQSQQSKPSQNMRYDPPQSRTRYTPMPPPVRFEQQQPPRSPVRYEQQQPARSPVRYEQQQPPSSARYEQQQRPSSSSSSSSSTHHGQQNQIDFPSDGYYEKIKNNINTHQYTTSWTEVSTQDGVSPTRSVNVDITSLGNSTNVQDNTRAAIIPYTNSTKTLMF